MPVSELEKKPDNKMHVNKINERVVVEIVSNEVRALFNETLNRQNISSQCFMLL